MARAVGAATFSANGVPSQPRATPQDSVRSIH